MIKEFKNKTVSLEHVGSNWYVVVYSNGSILYPPKPLKTKKQALETFNRIIAVIEEIENEEN